VVGVARPVRVQRSSLLTGKFTGNFATCERIIGTGEMR
jgi:hypothetical protein